MMWNAIYVAVSINFYTFENMTATDKNIIEAYASLFEGLSLVNKIKLIERLTKSLYPAKNPKKNFYKSFGAFASEKSPEAIIAEIKNNRKFKDKDLSF